MAPCTGGRIDPLRYLVPSLALVSLMHIIPLLYCTLYLATPDAGTIAGRFAPPPSAVRTTVATGSFAAYLRALPLLPSGTAVHTFNGGLKARQDVHAAVVDVSVGPKDLQQCADAAMRLRAEYLFAHGRHAEIHFNFTNGFRADFARWAAGERIKVKGNSCTWVRTGAKDASHASLIAYLDVVFTYAGTLSLSKELKTAGDTPIEAGDVFIQGGSPGHAVMVVDVARTPDGRQAFLIAQSYMPAQWIHVLKNLHQPDHGAWYMAGEGPVLATPEWTFRWSDRKRW